MIKSKTLITISEEEKIASKELIEFMKIISEPNRFNIILLLYKNEELSVSDISTYLKISQPAVSQHVKILKLSNFIKPRKANGRVFYSLDSDGMALSYKSGIDFLGRYFLSTKSR